MLFDRRQFLLLTGAAACAAAAGTVSLPAPAQLSFKGEPVMLEGDPFLATAHEGGLGGHSFEESRHLALRFRTPASERDRYVLGLEI